MAHGHHQFDEADRQPIGAKLWPTYRVLGAGVFVGLLLLVIGVALDALRTPEGEASTWTSRFFYAYLIGYSFVLSLTVGSVALVILTHLFRAGWVVAVRRVPETFAANFWIVGLLGLPILVAAMMPTAPLYSWSASLEYATERFEKAEQFLEKRKYAGQGDDQNPYYDSEDDDSAQDAAPAEAYVPVDASLYVATDAADKASESEAPAPDVVIEPAQGYQDLVNLMAGRAYDGATREENYEIQQAYYQSLLGYMLDYKRYGGQLMGNDLVPIGEDGKGEGFTWFNPMLFALRLVLYLAVLSVIGWFYWTRSVKQDETGDVSLTTKREWWAPASTAAFALMITFLSFDLIMSLDPAWYSTMFGVIFFANSITAAIALTILICLILQKKGYLKTVNIEHYHDLGKLLFAFVFFWGYVSFSQFMLIWYASFPETAYWFEIHGMTTVSSAPQYGSGWTYISLAMLFGHLFIPFAFLLSRHIKRNLTLLAGASAWMLVMVYLDFYWYIMPFFNSLGITFGFAEIGAVLMLLCIVLAAFVRRFAKHAPVAYGDPRLHETTALDTNVWAPIHH